MDHQRHHTLLVTVINKSILNSLQSILFKQKTAGTNWVARNFNNSREYTAVH